MSRSRAKPADQIDDGFLIAMVETDQRLVQQQKLRLAEQRLGQQQPLALAARHIRQRAPGEIARTHRGQASCRS